MKKHRPRSVDARRRKPLKRRGGAWRLFNRAIERLHLPVAPLSPRMKQWLSVWLARFRIRQRALPPSTPPDLRHDKYLHSAARQRRRLAWFVAHGSAPYPYDRTGYIHVPR